jgi:hypothetical protein
MPPTTTLIVLLAMFDGGFLSDGTARLHQTTVQSHDRPPNKSTPTADRALPSNTWRVYIEDPYVRDAARQMIEQAALWLSFPECQQLLSDFADERGQVLRSKLAELGVNAVEHLRLIVFEDGTNRSRCRQSGILAFTSPGSRVIYLCGRDFMRAAQRAPEDLRAIVIHEMLHSLGLGENPPSSREITRRVRERCWR